MEEIYLDLLIDFKHEVESSNNKKSIKEFFLFYTTILTILINGNNSKSEKMYYFLTKIDILKNINDEKNLLEIFNRLSF